MPCPICSKNPVETYRPFCSKRCADVDLGRWLNGSYAVASQDEDEAEEAAAALEQHLDQRPH